MSHPLVLAFIVLALGTCLAAIATQSGRTGYLRNLLISIGGLFFLIGLGALIGAVVRDFLLEVN